MDEKKVLKWLEEARTQPPDWEMFTKVQTYVVDKAKALGVKMQSTSVSMEELKPKAEQEVYEVMLNSLEWLWDCVWEKIREEQKLHPKTVQTHA
ncbi:MAG: hypothetical protein JSV12_02880 [Candidatus Bathyarchaeota archaeon]|nr:MAG: hypothetical protein JSV12_02880 [Candidatus Bathyarchaeota archaeon]